MSGRSCRDARIHPFMEKDQKMNEGRIKWIFFLFSFSMFTFCLGWWLHTCQSLCNKDCFLGSPDHSFANTQESQLNTQDTVPVATEDSSDSSMYTFKLI